MKISLITVSYNSVNTIEQTIKSVINQTYSNIEYIIVDGMSTDGTLDIIKKYDDFINKKVVEIDNGIYDAMNKGISLCTGDIIGILNSDDFYYDKYVLENIISTFKSSDVDSVYTDLVYVDKFDTNKIRRYWKSSEYNKSNFLFGWMPPHPSLFVKSKVYKNHGSFNLNFKISADYEFMLRQFFVNGISSKYLPIISVKMRIGGISNRNLLSRISAHKEDINAWKINKINPYFFSLLLKPTRKLLQYIIKP